MKTLIITRLVPSPANTGGKQRVLAMATRLAQMGQVAICGLDDGTADMPTLERLDIEVHSAPLRQTLIQTGIGTLRTRTASSGRFYSRAYLRTLREVAKGAPIDLLLVAEAEMLPFAQRSPPGSGFSDLDAVSSSLMHGYAATRKGVISFGLRVEAQALRRLEREAMREYDHTMLASDLERSRLSGPARSLLICKNGRDWSGALPPSPDPTAVFVASMNWAPNADAATWLVREIWPLVLRQRRDARLFLVGRNPPNRVRSLASESVTVTGTVADVAPYLAKAQIALAPLRSGGGTRLEDPRSARCRSACNRHDYRR